MDEDNNVICRTVADLIAELSKLPPETIPMSHEPPFAGVKVVLQNNGKVYLASLWNTDEGRAERAERNRAKRASGPIAGGGIDEFPQAGLVGSRLGNAA